MSKVRILFIIKCKYGFAKGINFLAKKSKNKILFVHAADIKINKSPQNLLKTFKLRKNCIVSVPKIEDYKNYNPKNKKNLYSKNMIRANF